MTTKVGERKQAFIAAVQDWARDAVIPLHEGCQCQGPYVLEFSQPPEEFAEELWTEFIVPLERAHGGSHEH